MSDHQQGPGWWLASDGKWYPPQGPGVPQQQGYQPFAQPPRPQKMSGWLMAVIIGLPILFGLVVLGTIVAIVSEDESGDDTTSDVVEGDRPQPAEGSDQAVTGTSPTQPAAEGEADEVDDVRIADCRTGDFSFMTAVLDVTNNSSDRSEYIISVAFENRAGTQQFGTGVALVNNLANGQTTRVEASSLQEAPAGPFRCVIASVQRFAF